MEDKSIINLLNKILTMIDPGISGPYGAKVTLTDEDYNRLLEDFKKFYESAQRHNYHEVTKFLLAKYNENEEAQEECVTLAMTIYELCKRADSQCVNNEGRLQCECLKPPEFKCEHKKNKECDKYKEVARALNKLYDHIQLEITRLNSIQLDNKALTNRAMRLEKSIKKNASIQKEVMEDFNQGKNDINVALTQFKITRNELVKQIEEISTKYDNMDDTYQEMIKEEKTISDKSDIIMKNTEELQDQTKQIYIQVVTILGIFTGVVFALFGGINGLAIISNAFITENIDINKLILLVSIVGIFIFNLVIVLLGIIFKLIKSNSKFSIFSITIVIMINIVCITGCTYSIHSIITNNKTIIKEVPKEQGKVVK